MREVERSSPRRLPLLEQLPPHRRDFGPEMIDAWQRSYEVGYHFNSELPPVIGRVPRTERAAFDSIIPFGATETNLLSHPDEAALIQSRLKVTFAYINADIAASGLDLSIFQIAIYRKQIAQGDFPIDASARELHLDNDFFYLIASKEPAEFYKGPAKIATKLGKIEPLASTTPVAAEPYDIVRMGPLNGHQSPLFSKPAERTTMQVFLC